MTATRYTFLQWSAEHVDTSEWQNGRITIRNYFQTFDCTDLEIEQELKKIGDRFLPRDKQKLISRVWRRIAPGAAAIVVTAIYEVNP